MAIRRTKTHFEQIPVELVKKIADPEVPTKKIIRDDNLIVRTPVRKTQPYSISVR
jgi:hypothetical protein